MMRFDTIVLGLGAMGSATAYQLARKGNRVLGIDRFSPPHVFGSTHGDTRITRLGIGEGAQYTPLAMRSHEIWRELERETGATLLTTNGGLVISSRAKTSQSHGDHFFANTVAAAEKFGIPHEIWDAATIRRRYPQFNIAHDESGYFEPSAGYVRPEECVSLQLRLAERSGAILHRNETVSGFSASDGGVTVTTGNDTYFADRLIVTAGPWLPGLVGRSIHAASHDLSPGALLVRHRRPGHAIPSGEFSGVHLGTPAEKAGDLRLSGDRRRSRRHQGRERAIRRHDNARHGGSRGVRRRDSRAV